MKYSQRGASEVDIKTQTQQVLMFSRDVHEMKVNSH